jgi:hypothetical protein
MVRQRQVAKRQAIYAFENAKECGVWNEVAEEAHRCRRCCGQGDRIEPPSARSGAAEAKSLVSACCSKKTIRMEMPTIDGDRHKKLGLNPLSERQTM